jgi:hypothetical protein
MGQDVYGDIDFLIMLVSKGYASGYFFKAKVVGCRAQTEFFTTEVNGVSAKEDGGF